MKYINPYTEFGAKHKAALDYIIANLPPNPTFEQLNEQLVSFFYVPDPLNPSPLDLLPTVLKTILPNTFNGYVKSKSTVYSPQTTEGQSLSSVDRGLSTSCNYKYLTEQQLLINKTLEGIRTVPVLQNGEYLSNMEEGVVSAGLSFEEQTPLLLALAIGKASNEYWLNQIDIAAAWLPYLNAETSINYGNLPGWVSTSMQGSLLAYGLIKPSPVPFTDVLASTVAGTGLVAGKVIWGWLKQ